MLTVEEVLANAKHLISFELNGVPMDTYLVKVTPEVARAVLDINLGNRLIRQEAVRKYKTDIRNNQWKSNGVPILIAKSDSGALILGDGQHRMVAIAESEDGTEIDFVFQVGVREADLNTVDAGVSRTTGDHLQRLGVPQAISNRMDKVLIPVIVSETKCGYHWFNEVRFRKEIPESQKLKWLEENEDVVSAILAHDSLLRFTGLGTGTIIGTGPFLTAFAMIWKADPQSAVDFYRVLTSGFDENGNAAQGDPRVMLRIFAGTRKSAISESKPHVSMDPQHWIYTIIRAWARWMNGERVLDAKETFTVAERKSFSMDDWIVPADVVASLTKEEPLAA